MPVTSTHSPLKSGVVVDDGAFATVCACDPEAHSTNATVTARLLIRGP